MQVKALIEKLSNPHWFKMPDPAPVVIAAGSEGTFNMYWYMCDMPEMHTFTDAYLLHTLPRWKSAHHIANQTVDGALVEETATVLGPSDLYTFLCQHREDLAKKLIKKDWSENAYGNL